MVANLRILLLVACKNLTCSEGLIDIILKRETCSCRKLVGFDMIGPLCKFKLCERIFDSHCTAVLPCYTTM